MMASRSALDLTFHVDGLARGEILVQYCVPCRRYQFPPTAGCRVCGRAEGLRIRDVSGQGRIYAWTDAHYAFEPEFAEDVPFTVVEVKLDEGVRIYGRLAAGLKPAADLRVYGIIQTLRGQPILVFVADGVR